jgi:chemotaxis methyl-accepting protein methylase
MNSMQDQLIEVMSLSHGRDVSCYDEAFLAKTLGRRMASAGYESAKDYVADLSDNGAEAESFSKSLSICYSEFFRNPLTFALLEQLILPSLIEAREKSGRSEIRIWSAGCAAGQEAYSVAILLDEQTRAHGHPVPFRIFGTDRDESVLDSARLGVYDQAAVQNVCLRHLREYFTREGESYVLAERLRAQVDFSFYDLLDERNTCPPASIFGDFDLILCSNVLFYYRQEVRRNLVEKMRRALTNHGYFITGEVERFIVEQCGEFRAVDTPVWVFQKV